MTRTGNTNRGKFVSQATLGVALALGLVSAGVVAPSPAMAAKKKDEAPKSKPSKGFIAVAGPAQNALNELKPEDPASVADVKAKIEAATNAIENEDDRLIAGSFTFNLGAKTKDTELQRAGLKLMIDSGKSDPAAVPRYYAAAGQLAYQAQDFPEAQHYLQMAVDSGTAEAGIKVMLGEAYIAGNQTAKGLGVFKTAINESKASGELAPESWYRRGLLMAYKSQSIDDTTDFAVLLVRDYPKNENWGVVSTFLRELGNFNSKETLDLMRLMGRTNSYVEARDYIEYIQAADPRRLPGEALSVINAGIASGKLSSSDTSIADWKMQASARVEDDKSSLSSYARDARKPGASEATITGAADALLSYGQSAEAEELYMLALSKPGVDTAEALTRLGIAEVDQGKYAEAQESFGKVTGNRRPIARVWAAYAAHKAESGPAPAPVAAATGQ